MTPLNLAVALAVAVLFTNGQIYIGMGFTRMAFLSYAAGLVLILVRLWSIAQ